MYSSRIRYVLGFHGCDQTLCNKAVLGDIDIAPSSNNYDWLGNGIYFWERDPERALSYAQFLKRNPQRGNPIHIPAALGAVIDMGFCLDIIDPVYHKEVKEAFEELKKEYKAEGKKLPENKIKVEKGAPKLRELDCAVLECLHRSRVRKNLPPYDSVRGVFWEGQPLFPGTVVRERSHVQLCIRNPLCIKGYFIPKGVF